MKHFVAAILVLAGVLVTTAGCSDAERFYVNRLEVARSSWDSLDVDAVFQGRSLMGQVGTVVPDTIRYVLFDAAFDTLYAGPSSRIPVPDVNMGDEEALLVEVCGRWNEFPACSQKTILASPKRAIAGFDVDYPQETGAYDRGAFDVAMEIERRRFEDDSQWESIEPGRRPEMWFQTYLEGAPSPHVRIPVTRTSARFNISRSQNYRDLRFGIESSLLDVDSAQVRFDLYARVGKEPVRTDSREVVIRSKTREERREELDRLIEAAGNQLLDRLKGMFGVRRGLIFVNDWTYRSLERSYRAEFELHWQDSFRGSWSDLTGELQVRADGSAGSIRWIRGSQSARDRWDDRFGGDNVILEPLFEERFGLERVGDDRDRSRRRRTP